MGVCGSVEYTVPNNPIKSPGGFGLEAGCKEAFNIGKGIARLGSGLEMQMELTCSRTD
jgi:hypothetical protein